MISAWSHAEELGDPSVPELAGCTGFSLLEAQNEPTEGTTVEQRRRPEAGIGTACSSLSTQTS